MKAWQIFVPFVCLLAAAFAIERRSHEAQVEGLRRALSASRGEEPLAKAPTVNEIRDRCQAAFDAESPDPSWAPSAQSTAKARLTATLPPGSTLGSIDCRTSLCRVETKHVDRAHFEKYVTDSFKDPKSSVWNGATFSSFLGDPSATPVSALSYVAREGANLPALD